MKQIQITDDFIKAILCTLIAELKKIPEVTKQPYIMIILKIIEMSICE
jgi:hypothetical protein